MSNEANIKRLSEIQQQISDLTIEGMKIADEEQVKFSLGSAPFTNNYGSGGLEYFPNGDGPYYDPEYGDDYELTDLGGEKRPGSVDVQQ